MVNMTAPARRELAAILHEFGLERDRMRAALARRARISQTDLDALEHLEAAGSLTQRELGERLSLTSGAVTMLADRLEAAGLVRRRPHPADRRYVVLELSSQAMQRAPSGLRAYHAAIADLVAGIPAEQAEVIGTFLSAAAMAAARAAGSMETES
jgi:DNA-binding MarR family transcriptional regulator